MNLRPMNFPSLPWPFPKLGQRYYCYHEACPSVATQQGFKLAALLFACPICTKGAGCREDKDATNLRCAVSDMAKGMRCPDCEDLLLEAAALAPPLPISAGPSSGKSVLLAVMAQRLRQPHRLSDVLRQEALTDSQLYDTRVVAPLFATGIVPDKTHPGDHAQFVLGLAGSGGWRSGVLRFWDVAGEVWDGETHGRVKGTNVGEHQRAALLRAGSSIFVADPERIEGLRQRTRFNLWSVVDEALAATCPMDRPPETVRRRFGLLENYLQTLAGSEKLGYPHLPFEHHHAKLIARELECGDPYALAVLLEKRRIGDPDAEEPEKCSGLLGRRSSLNELQMYTQYMRAFSLDRRVRAGKRKVPHRLALVIAKSDAIRFDKSYPYCHDDDVLGELPKSERLSDWRDALERRGDGTEKLLPECKDLIRYARQNYQTVQLFLVAALGRGTEPVLGNFEGDWRIAKQQLRRGVTGRAPDDRDVLLPLYWLLAS